MNDNRRHAVSKAPVPALEPSGVADSSGEHTSAEGDFSSLLRRLSAGIRKEDVKRREGWRDRNGQTHYVEYVEWHLVADLLDKLAPTWSHAVRSIVQIGDYVAATAAITIDGVTREGTGTGPAGSETGIKKAEHDALKRAAVKFGVARDLYRDEDKMGEPSRPSGNRTPAAFPSDPMARTAAELISPKQLSLIRNLAKSQRLDPEAVCRELYRAGLGEISRKAASALIEHLNAKHAGS
ncbi:MAG: RAD52 family DNA repair protein [Acidobacteria bacterium]|nr:RAD52 family DNA repair protein [Acidobacteriota bacterium]